LSDSRARGIGEALYHSAVISLFFIGIYAFRLVNTVDNIPTGFRDFREGIRVGEYINGVTSARAAVWFPSHGLSIPLENYFWNRQGQRPIESGFVSPSFVGMETMAISR